MKDVPESELLSAYLDGELTAAEQANADQLLSRSPAARQLLDELHALSSTLQALPQCKLGEDLSRQVLQAAQRRRPTTSAAPEELPQPAPPARRALLRRLVSSRALVWSSLAVALAVILTVMDRGPQKQIAVAPPAAEEAAKEKARPALAIKSAPKEAVAPGESGAEPAGTSQPTEESRKAGRGSAAEKYGAKLGAGDLTEERDADSLTPGGVQGKRYVAEKAQAIRGGSFAKGAAGGPPVQWDLLVQCRLGAEATGKAVFDQALAENGIVWDEAPAAAGAVTSNAAAIQQQRLEPVAQQKPDDTNQPAAELETAPAEKVGLVYVEAPRDQVQGLLRALETRPEAISLVSSESVTRDETPQGPGGTSAGQVQLPEGGGTGGARGFQVGGAAAKAPAAPPAQRPASGYEGQSKLGLRAYARRLHPSAIGSEPAAEFGRAAAPLQRSPKPEQLGARQPLKQKARGGGAEIPLVRALFVLHLADVGPALGAGEAKSAVGKAAPGDHQAAPPAAVQQ